MDDKESSKAIQRLLEERSGKSVLTVADRTFSGYSTIRIAGPDSPAHVLLYKPEFESELPYLVAFQCGLALRTVQSEPKFRFDVVSTDRLHTDVRQLVTDHLRISQPGISTEMIPKLADQLANGLGLQLRSMPIAIRVDDWIYRDFPALRPLQQQSIERQIQEAMHALSPSVREFAPQKIIDTNVSMSTAFATFWSRTWNETTIPVAFVSAGYGKIGSELLDDVDSVDESPNFDRLIVEAWAKRLSIDCWFKMRDKV